VVFSHCRVCGFLRRGIRDLAALRFSSIGTRYSGLRQHSRIAVVMRARYSGLRQCSRIASVMCARYSELSLQFSHIILLMNARNSGSLRHCLRVAALMRARYSALLLQCSRIASLLIARFSAQVFQHRRLWYLCEGYLGLNGSPQPWQVLLMLFMFRIPKNGGLSVSALLYGGSAPSGPRSDRCSRALATGVRVLSHSGA
jgi:hypothetical protein